MGTFFNIFTQSFWYLIFVLKKIWYYPEKNVKPLFTEIYKFKFGKNGHFLQFWWFLRILTILGVACHVQISAIGFIKYSNPHCRLLVIKIELCKITNPPQAVFTSSQIFIFLLLKFFLEPNFKPHLLTERKR